MVLAPFPDGYLNFCCTWCNKVWVGANHAPPPPQGCVFIIKDLSEELVILFIHLSQGSLRERGWFWVTRFMPFIFFTKAPIPEDPHKNVTFKKFLMHFQAFNPFSPKSDQLQNFPCISIAYSHEILIILPILTTSLIHFSLKG